MYKFNHNFYLSEYPDIKRVGLKTHNSCINHYNNNGIYEGRFCSKEHKDKFLNMYSKINETFGFIITSHVISEKTNEYWINCYQSIRKHYKNNQIIIIRDNCDLNFLKIPENMDLTNCTIIDSEFQESNDLLPYYYHNKLKLFDVAIIINESTFIKEELPLNILDIKTTKYLWDIIDDGKKINNIIEIRNKINNFSQIHNYYNKYKIRMKSDFKFSFTSQSIISLSFLEYIEEKYKIFNFIEEKISFSDLFSIICKLEDKNVNSIFGNIFKYIDKYYSNVEYSLNKLGYNDITDNTLGIIVTLEQNDIIEKYLELKSKENLKKYEEIEINNNECIKENNKGFFSFFYNIFSKK